MKCSEFDPCALNSDAKCFEDDLEKSKNKVEETPSICQHCVYNKKFEGYSYNRWEEYQKLHGLPTD